MIPGYVDFEFDLPNALLSHLIGVLDEMDPALLDPENLTSIPEAQGVYQLFLDGNLVYIGKTDAEAGLRKRLGRHALKIMHRVGLDTARVSFKAVRIYVFTAVDLESQLIRHYGGLRQVSWNGSGFGSNDPGRERDTTKFKEGHFDLTFPIDIDHPIRFAGRRNGHAAEFLSDLKTALPYVFRFQTAAVRSRKPHPDFDATLVEINELGPVTARGIIEQIVRALPRGWQATKLPSHIILYKEARHYPAGDVIATS
ncbi:GIY-YIG nuclease family protein [Eilatimonas milleporae]|uniref:Eco29kI restriction endonuclease n=1 Tax=Eilatimonas milleporae TaxID=911205 RepID=A0A3M0CGR2_9PROT|nr:GIY-YIG nuclease family protein [Eilatimonas milleporae]RMB07977.1 hypothetical protein BXY39_2071 [Eilatimonas milleporae]